MLRVCNAVGEHIHTRAHCLGARSAKRALRIQMQTAINYGCMYATEAPLKGALIVTHPPPFTDAPITA